MTPMSFLANVDSVPPTPITLGKAVADMRIHLKSFSKAADAPDNVLWDPQKEPTDDSVLFDIRLLVDEGKLETAERATAAKESLRKIFA